MWTLTLAQIRWVYKRNNWKIQKVRTKNKETRSLYNYESIWAFEHGHYDTKELADAKSLPSHVYEKILLSEVIDLMMKNFLSHFETRWKPKNSLWNMLKLTMITGTQSVSIVEKEWKIWLQNKNFYNKDIFRLRKYLISRSYISILISTSFRGI